MEKKSKASKKLRTAKAMEPVKALKGYTAGRFMLEVGNY